MTGRGFCLACLAAWVGIAALAMDMAALSRLLDASADWPLASGLIAGSLAAWAWDCLLIAAFMKEEG